MPSANNDETYCDIFSSEFDHKLRVVCNGIAIDKHRLKEFALSRARDVFIKKHGIWIVNNLMRPGALDKLLEENNKIDLARDLQNIVHSFLAQQKTNINQSAANIFTAESCSTELNDIDKKIHKGGRTELHFQAANGKLDAVKHLVEELHARTDIKDNAKQTAYSIALQMGRKEVAEYLKNFPR
jgi:hypothetical protein